MELQTIKKTRIRVVVNKDIRKNIFYDRQWWLPSDPGKPPISDIKIIPLILEILTDEKNEQFWLVLKGLRPDVDFDYWFETLEEALEDAEFNFGVMPEDWESA